MAELTNPHDRFFKAVFGRTEVAAEFLARYLPPAAVAALDWGTLRPVRDSFLDPELAAHRADLLYQADLRGGGGAGYVHLLFEHKSYVESRIGLDLLRYRVRIWELWREAGHTGRLPVIVPVVVYHGLEAWRVSRQFADGVVEVAALRAYVPECIYHLVDLSDYRDEELRGAVVMHTALLALKYIFRNELRERVVGILRLVQELEQSSSGLDDVEVLLRYLAQGASTDRLNADELRQAVVQTLSGGGELMLTIAEQWVQQGRQEGRQEGLFSERQLLLRLVRKRFGEVVVERSRARLERVEDMAVLEELGEAVLDCVDGEAWLAVLARRV